MPPAPPITTATLPSSLNRSFIFSFRFPDMDSVRNVALKSWRRKRAGRRPEAYPGNQKPPRKCLPYSSTMATRRTMPPSASSQRKGKAAMVQRLPVTSSTSPPAFFYGDYAFAQKNAVGRGSYSGKSSSGSFPVSLRYSGPARAWSGKADNATGGCRVAPQVPATPFIFFSTSHSAASAPQGGIVVVVLVVVPAPELVPPGVHDTHSLRFRSWGWRFPDPPPKRCPTCPGGGNPPQRPCRSSFPAGSCPA